jgi:hypothetical protein
VGGYLVGGLVLGGVLVPTYVIRRRHDSPKLEVAVTLFISGVAIATGVKLIAVCATASNIKPFGTEDRVYIVIGGLALIWVSVQTILGFLGFLKAKSER